MYTRIALDLQRLTFFLSAIGVILYLDYVLKLQSLYLSFLILSPFLSPLHFRYILVLYLKPPFRIMSRAYLKFPGGEFGLSAEGTEPDTLCCPNHEGAEASAKGARARLLIPLRYPPEITFLAEFRRLFNWLSLSFSTNESSIRSRNSSFSFLMNTMIIIDIRK